MQITDPGLNNTGALMRLVLLSLAAILASAVREAFFHAFVVNIVVHDEMGFNTEAFKAKKSDCSLLLGFLDCGLRIPTPSGFGFDVCVRGPLQQGSQMLQVSGKDLQKKNSGNLLRLKCTVGCLAVKCRQRT